jgi:hypothetical protein
MKWRAEATGNLVTEHEARKWQIHLTSTSKHQCVVRNLPPAWLVGVRNEERKWFTAVVARA